MKFCQVTMQESLLEQFVVAIVEAFNPIRIDYANQDYAKMDFLIDVSLRQNCSIITQMVTLRLITH